ncbi:hypothetical protein CSA17_02420 [bacterium DOLJORAL78_65_58]|nr:MAG: hypothetical protein CSB20_01315 [bacterium DOLZORAL124_64_63]PIE76398.1 MAG: hypothetical protein CSA17_02420 [bacterium DOLJORAL78_65_58]
MTPKQKYPRLTPLAAVFLALLVLVVLVAGGNWAVYMDLLDIRRVSAPLPAMEAGRDATTDSTTVVRVGVVSRFAPSIIYRLYQPIMDYCNAHSARRHQLSLSQSYSDAAQRLRTGEDQASFLGALMCSRLPRDSELEPTLIPLNKSGSTAFHVALIVKDNSPIGSLADLTHRRVALPSRKSFSGMWLQRAGLASAGLTVADLDTLQHFKHHETVVWQVLRGNFDAGVVKESLARRYRTRGLRVVALSPAIPGPPLVINRRFRDEATDELVRLLLALDPTDPADRRLMATWTQEFAYGFRAVDRAEFLDLFQDPLPAPEEEP